MRIIWITHDLFEVFLPYVKGRPTLGGSWIAPLFYLLNNEPEIKLGSITPVLNGKAQRKEIDHIILAGFLWKVPAPLVSAWAGRIINIHPALLPKFGGKGMYGKHVHDAVIAAGEKESGISIHEVDEIYDNGAIIFQAKCAVAENETAESLAKKIHALEHAHFPKELEKFIERSSS